MKTLSILLDQYPHYAAKLNRRQIARTAALLLIVLFLFHAYIYTHLSSQCRSLRHNSRIKTPIISDHSAISALWPPFKKILTKHGTSLPTLARPHWHAMAPDRQAIHHRTRLLQEEECEKVRASHEVLISNLPEFPQGLFHGHGIVMLGGGKYSEYASIALGVLREIGSELPVEIWSRDEREEKPGWCEELKEEGIACRRLSDYMGQDAIDLSEGKALKVFTMLFSSFEEIIFLDADNFALEKPEILFQSKEYKDYGVILWPDFGNNDNIAWLDYIIGLAKGPSEVMWDEPTIESGQIVWDKRRHWKSLLLATSYNFWGSRFYYTLLNFGFAGWGDKDTFPTALRALNEDSYRIPYTPGRVYITDHTPNSYRSERTGAMLQYSPQTASDDPPIPFFLHANIIKWSMRDLSCEGCLPIWTDTNTFTSRFEDDSAELHSHLHGNTRIFDRSSFGDFRSVRDPELLVWRAIEYAACRSSYWRQSSACNNVRQYMTGTFGVTFTSARGIRQSDQDTLVAELCIEEPSI